jgi:hypothetical protein
MTARGLLIFSVTWLITLTSVSTTAAAGPTTAGITVEVGIGGVVKSGFWTPVTVRLPEALVAAPTRLVAVEAEDPDGQWLRSPAVRPEPSGDGNWAARLLIKRGRRGGDLRVVVLTGTQGDTQGDTQGRGGEALKTAATPAVLREVIPLPDEVDSTQELLLVIGSLENAERAVRLAAREDGTRALVINAAPPSETATIPLAAGAGPPGLAYDAIDRAIVCGRAIAAGGREQQLAELDQWVRDGGDLVLLAGMSLPEMVAASPTAAGWLPGQFSRLIPLRQTAALETYARANRPLDRGAIDGLKVPVFAAESPLDGITEAVVGGATNDPPLVIRRAHGFGRITWIGIDLDTRTFQTWPGTDSLLLELLDTGRLDLAGGRTAEVRRGGLDLAGQLRLAIDRYPGVSAVPFELIALLGLLYVAALYPLDWWLASRFQHYGWLAWLPLPLLVITFTAISWGAATSYKQSGWQLHTAGIVDIDQASGGSRAASYAGVWAADNGRFSLAVSPDHADDLDTIRTAVSWFAAPGRSLGGPDALTPHPSLAAADYHYAADLSRLDTMPMAAASSRLFESTWTGQISSLPFRSTLERTGQGTLRGTLQSQFSATLNDCVLVHGGWLYDVGTLAPGDRFDAAEGRGPRSLGATLTRQQVVKDRSVASRWDADAENLDRILEIAGLFAAAGGSGYTGLEAGRLARLDLSRLLPLDRAILIGRGPPATRWTIDRSGPTEASATAVETPTVLWRVVLPVGN